MIRHQYLDNASQDKPVPQGTLRGHNGNISAISYVYLPSNFSYAAPDDEHTVNQLLIPTLVSADETGWTIWWDLNTKRPLAAWQAHPDNTIMSIRQLGISWKEDGSPVLDLKLYGKILTHGKDCLIKFWDLFKILDEKSLAYRLSGNFVRKLPNSIIGASWGHGANHPALVYELPVNTLNYCNVDLFGRQLITPSTTNSNNFDIYVLPESLPETEDTTKLERVFNDVDLYKLINPLEEVSSDGAAAGRDFGIIMRLVFLDSETVAAGFESGDVVIVSLKDYEVSLLKHDAETHRPNPILAMSYVSKPNLLLATSANDKILAMQIHAGTDSTSHQQQIKHHGICSVSAADDKKLALVTWDGITRIYKRPTTLISDDHEFELLFKFNKLTPSVRINDMNMDQEKEKLNKPIKASIAEFSRSQPSYTSLKEAKNLQYNNGESKMIIRKREMEVMDKQWLSVGYNDGRIVFYDVRHV